MASAPVIAIGKPLLKTYRRYAAYKSKFDDWRAVRPFWGAALLLFAGVLLAYIPFYTLENFAFTGGTGELIGLIGLLFAFFVFLSGVAAMTQPRMSTLAGLTGIIMSILSVVGGTFGAMGIGTFVGMVGGSLCVAWIQEEETVAVETNEDADVEELRKKAKKYEKMMAEGELEAEDIEDEDITMGELEERVEDDATEAEPETEPETEAGTNPFGETAFDEEDYGTSEGAVDDTDTGETETDPVAEEPGAETDQGNLNEASETEDTNTDADAGIDGSADEDDEDDRIP